MAKKYPDDEFPGMPGAGEHEDDLPLESLRKVSRKVGGQWKELGRRMGLTYSILDIIAQQCKYDGAQEKAYQTILSWKQRNQSTATWDTLVGHVESATGKKTADLVAGVPSSTKGSAPSKPASRTINKRLPSKFSTIIHQTPVIMEKPIESLGENKQKSSMPSTNVAREKMKESPGGTKQRSKQTMLPTAVTKKKLVESPGGIKQKYLMDTQINNQGCAALITSSLQTHELRIYQNIYEDIPKQTTMKDPETEKNGKTLPSKEDAVSFTGNNSSITLKELQANLQKRYKTLRMKGLPWMTDLCLSLEDHYVALEMVKEKKTGNEERDSRYKGRKKFELEDIIQFVSWDGSCEEQKSWKILVEGDAGFGKTTLASKLCYDYGNSKKYVQQFDVVLLFPLRNFFKNLDEMIFKAAFVTKEQVPSLSEIINNKSVRTLIILDGYDELSHEHVNSILPLIRGEILPHVSLVVTSRLGRFTEKHSDPTADVEFDTEPLWDCEYKMIGLNEERQAEFVKRHLKSFSSDERRRIERELKEVKEQKLLTPDFLKCPLFFLMIFMILSEGNHSLQHVRTVTELYKEILNFVMRRYLTKYGFRDASKADLFTFDNAIRPFYIDLMAKLGEISLSAIKTEQLFFSRELVSKLDPKIVKLGILTQTSLVNGLHEVLYYEPVHKSLIEFAAAFSLLISFTEGPRDQWHKHIVELGPTQKSFASLVFPFLAGLMGNKAGALFDAIQSHADEYAEEFNILTRTLHEIHVTDSVMTSLIPFLPTMWHTYWLDGSILTQEPFFLSSEIMLMGLKAGKIKEISWNLASRIHITQDIKVDTLSLGLSYKIYPLTDSRFQRIECRSVVLHIGFTPCDKEIKDILTMVRSFHFQHISFSFDLYTIGKYLPLIHESVVNGILNGCHIHEICCRLQKEDSNMLDLLNDLIKRERIESLVIVFIFLPSQQQLQILFTGIAKSSHLAKIELNCEEKTCPLAVELAKLHKGNTNCKVYNSTTRECMYSS